MSAATETRMAPNSIRRRELQQGGERPEAADVHDPEDGDPDVGHGVIGRAASNNHQQRVVTTRA